MLEETMENADQTEPHTGAAKLVPVGESIKYRRRAQQAESHLQEIEQKLEELQAQFAARDAEIATAEAQRDEVRMQLTTAENRLAVERLLNQAGAVDIETASLLLSKMIDFGKQLDAELLARHVEQLLLDKPFLRGADGALSPSLPPKTASAKAPAATPTAQLAQAAERAARTGNRRDIAEYLRLRRQTATT